MVENINAVVFIARQKERDQLKHNTCQARDRKVSKVIGQGSSVSLWFEISLNNFKRVNEFFLSA